ncbi:MAG: ATP-binding cassette domain-containing protein [Deltaproteobacteria bacterium]
MIPAAPALSATINVTLGDSHRPFQLEADFELQTGVLVLFGPSGSGKSSCLRALAGHLRPGSGLIKTRTRTLYDSSTGVWVPPQDRGFGYLPQQRSLFPFCSVLDNVTFGLPRQQRRRGNTMVMELMEELKIADLAAKTPGTLSGGEAQRVALARALAPQPDLLLLDEPFTSLDREGRDQLIATVAETLKRHTIPCVLVTHDPEEAAALGTTALRFDKGRTVVCPDPARLADQPDCGA